MRSHTLLRLSPQYWSTHKTTPRDNDGQREGRKEKGPTADRFFPLRDRVLYHRRRRRGEGTRPTYVLLCRYVRKRDFCDVDDDVINTNTMYRHNSVHS